VLPTTLWEWSAWLFQRVPAKPFFRLRWKITRRDARLLDRLWNVLLIVAATLCIVFLARFVQREADYAEIGQVFLLGLITAARVLVLLALASLVWVPIGVWIGLRPALAQRLQPLALFLAAFPANLLFPLVVWWIVTGQHNPEIWLSPLMILGTQWYILFNVIAGASAIPADLREAAANLGLKGWALWRRLILPAIFPAYLTGGITASGGAWNASVVAEIASWGSTTLAATGLGAYIAEQTASGDHPRVALGIAVMSLYVVALNRLVWSRLYRWAERKLTLE
jgi:NitT/TauT family transport system permease protein